MKLTSVHPIGLMALEISFLCLPQGDYGSERVNKRFNFRNVQHTCSTLYIVK